MATRAQYYKDYVARKKAEMGEDAWLAHKRAIVYKSEQKDRRLTNERHRANQHRYRKDNPKKYLFNLAKRRSKARGMEFTVSLEDLPEVPHLCPLLGIEIDQYSDVLDFRASIDRIDSSAGYVPGNVWFISHRANRIKSDATAEELALMAAALKEKQESQS